MRGSLLPATANLLWYLSSLPESLAFRRATRDVAGSQWELLRALLTRNADTLWGRRYGFASIRSAADYQARVPITGHEDYRSLIERVGAGEPALLTAERVLLLEPTSGSSAASKLIPYTTSLKGEFQRAIAPWIVDLFQHDPGLIGGQAYWSVTPVTRREARTPGGIPIGFEEDSEYFGWLQGKLVRSVLAVPSLVRLVDEMENFFYLTLLFLLRSRSLTLISVWNPTFLMLLVGRLDGWHARLSHDIARGTLTLPRPLAPELHESFSLLNRADERRAAEIESACAEADSPADRHLRLWPRLRLLSCWTEGAAAGPALELAALFPQARLQGKGLIATEGFVSFPLHGQPGAALALRSHFFEFVPPGATEGPPCLAHQLQEGRRYSVLLTTGGGLYRYRLHDLVEVTGHHGGCPLLRFVGKEDHISDRFGEKVNERHVASVLDRLFPRYDLRPSFAMLACEEWEEGHAYTLFLEASGASDGQLASLAAALEESLQENFHYRYCRDLGQLAPARLFRVLDGAQESYLAGCRAQGQRVGDVKLVSLHPRPGWRHLFRGYDLPVEQKV